MNRRDIIDRINYAEATVNALGSVRNRLESTLTYPIRPAQWIGGASSSSPPVLSGPDCHPIRSRIAASMYMLDGLISKEEALRSKLLDELFPDKIETSAPTLVQPTAGNWTLTPTGKITLDSEATGERYRTRADARKARQERRKTA